MGSSVWAILRADRPVATSSLETWVAPQQFQSESSSSSIPRAAQTARVETSISFPVDRDTQPG